MSIGRLAYSKTVVTGEGRIKARQDVTVVTDALVDEIQVSNHQKTVFACLMA